MKKKEQYKRLLSFLDSAIIIFLLTAVFSYIWFHFYDKSDVLLKTFWRRGNYVVIGLYGVLVFLFLKLYGGLRIGHMRVFEVLYSQILSLLCVNGFTYLQLCLIGHWRFLDNLLPIVLMTVIDIVLAVIWVVISRTLYLKLYPAHKVVVIHGNLNPGLLIRKLNSRKDRYDVAEMISIDQGVDAVKEKIRQYRCALLADIPDDDRNRLIKFCFANDIRCYAVPKISDIMIKSSENIYQFDTALMLFRNQGLPVEQQFIKRLFDIVASLIAIVLASPFMLVIAVCIKAYDGGPVFFTQERLTKDGEVFRVFKFRSMRVENEKKEYCLTRKDDDRITPVGKIIRNIHFDELPQLFNILKGDMSLVGPRPETPQVAQQYTEILPEFAYRLKVKAGLTGFAQVYGKYNTTPYDKLKMDLTYIERYSFLLDLKLMLLTFKILFQKENTEGIEAWQTTAAPDLEPEKAEK